MINDLTHRDILLIDDIDRVSTLSNSELAQLESFLLVVNCWQGKVQVTVNNERYLLTDKHLLICHASFLVDNFMRTPDCKCGILCIKAEYFTEVLNSNFHLEPRWWEKYTLLQRYPIVEMTEYEKQLLIAYYGLIDKYLNGEQTPFREKMLRRLAELAYLEVSHYFENKIDSAPSSVQPAISSPNDRIFKNFIDMLQVYPIRQREVKWYADRLCVTPKYLSAVCRAKSGLSATKLIHNRLTEQLRHALVDTDMTLKEIVHAFNFPSRSFFGKYVKHTLGMPPKQYRITQQKAINEKN